MNKTTILFDLDGTLLDTAPDILGSFNELLRRHQRPELSIDAIRHLLTHGSKYFITNFFDPNATEAEIKQISKEFLEIYSQSGYKQTRFFPGMSELLLTITERNIFWGIVTNKSTKLTLENLMTVPFPAQPHAVVCGDTLPVYKPDPAPLLHACKLLNVSPAEVIFIGDSEVDAEAGFRAGIDTIIMEHGYHEGAATFTDAKITAFICNPIEILKWL